MKVFFIASLNQKEKFVTTYDKIVTFLREFEVEVDDSHITESSLDDVINQTDEERLSFYHKFIKSINSVSCLVAEISYPSSVGVGTGIGIALERGRPVLALYKTGNEPNFLQGLGQDNEKLILLQYSDDEDLKKKLKQAIKKVQKIQDIRFNFFISPEIVRYLDWVAKVKRVPRSVYLRDLIEDDMKKHKEYGTQS